MTSNLKVFSWGAMLIVGRTRTEVRRHLIDEDVCDPGEIKLADIAEESGPFEMTVDYGETIVECGLDDVVEWYGPLGVIPEM